MSDGANAPGSCVSCPEPLVGNIDLRFPNNPDRVCQILSCPERQEKLFSVSALDFTEYSNRLFLSTYYEHREWYVYGPPKELSSEIETFDKTVAIDMFNALCPDSHPNDLGSGECCTDAGKVLHVANINLNGLYNNFTGPLIKTLEQCAALALEDYRNSKGFFTMRSTDCYIYQGRYSFSTRYVFPLNEVTDWHETLTSRTKGLLRLTSNIAYKNYIAYFDCPVDSRTQKR